MGTDVDWARWGEDDPYFGVLSDDRYRRSALAANREAFLESGRAFVERRLGALEGGLGEIHRGRALDFGCGVGRLALPMADRFEAVVGVDIAPAMLAEARTNAAATGRSNLTFRETVEAGARFDFVNTYIVIQHIPVAQGLAVIATLMEATAPGGVISLHLCTRRAMGPLGRLLYAARLHVPLVRGVANLARGRDWGAPVMEMNPYPLDTVLEMLAAGGFDPPMLETEMHGRFETVLIGARRQGA